MRRRGERTRTGQKGDLDAQLSFLPLRNLSPLASDSIHLPVSSHRLSFVHVPCPSVLGSFFFWRYKSDWIRPSIVRGNNYVFRGLITEFSGARI